MKTPSLRDKLFEKVREAGDERNSGARGEATEIELPPRVTARVSAKALKNNYLAIHAQAAERGMIPMLKADAYGHGMLWAARELVQMQNLYAFGVATLEEGKALRDGLGLRSRKVRIIVFSGATPFNDEVGQFCEAFNLTPVIASEDDWTRFVNGKWPGRIPYELKFNTGMNRLGVSFSQVNRFRDLLAKLEPEARPEGIFTHLATAENPDHTLTQTQLEKFRKVRAELGPVCPGALFHFANSAAIWTGKHYDLEGLSDLVRPGISLYGIPPWKGAPQKNLSPVLTLESRIIRVNSLKAGESVGYGATYRTDAPQTIGIVPAGYGDGVPRSLGKGGKVRVGDRIEKILGIVSMDLMAISVAPSTQVGERVEIFGPGVSVADQAAVAGTIPYELLTSITARVSREFS